METQNILKPLSLDEIESQKIVHEFMSQSLSRIFKLLEGKKDNEIKPTFPLKNQNDSFDVLQTQD